MSPSANAKTLLATYDALTRRDLDAVVEVMAEEFVAVDHATRTTLDRDGMRLYMQQLLAASSDCRSRAELIADLGDLVIVKVLTDGTHNGEWAGIAPTGAQFSIEQCEIQHFNEHGRIIRSELYYDLYGILCDMGVVQLLAATTTS